MNLSYQILLVLKVHHILQKIYYPKIFFDNKFYGGYDELAGQAKLDNLSLFR